MLENGKRLTDFNIERFIGRAILFDVRWQKEIDEAYIKHIKKRMKK